MYIKFALAVCFLCCVFLGSSNAQSQPQYDRQFEILKARDKNKPVVPLPSVSPQNQPQYNQQNHQQNNKPDVPVTTPRAQTQHNQQPNYVQNKPVEQPTTPRTQNPPQYNPQNNPQYQPLYYIPRLPPNLSIQQQVNWHQQQVNKYLSYLHQQHQNFLLTINPNLRPEFEMNSLASNIPDNRRPFLGTV